MTTNFSFSQIVFYSFEGPSANYIKFEIVVCKLFQFDTVWYLSKMSSKTTYAGSSALGFATHYFFFTFQSSTVITIIAGEIFSCGLLQYSKRPVESFPLFPHTKNTTNQQNKHKRLQVFEAANHAKTHKCAKKLSQFDRSWSEKKSAPTNFPFVIVTHRLIVATLCRFQETLTFT